MTAITNYQGIRWTSSSTDALELSTAISPEAYLAYAKKDISENNGTRGIINSVSNAKRALHLQSELLSDALGIRFLVPKGQISFPKRLDFLKDCGIVGGSILKKLNRIRNAIEHDYDVPSEETAQDFVDIIELFIAASSRIIKQFPSQAGVEYDDCPKNTPELRDVIFPPGEGKLYLFSLPRDEHSMIELDSMELLEWQIKHSLQYSPQDQEYYEWVKWMIDAHF